MSVEQDKISVIVPVYNVERYLHRCVDSILAQTHTNFELILVDDGSPDNCGMICDEYATQDDRITVIHQENGGVSAARNTGLDWMFANSDSQWITFVDSDDCIRPQMLEHLYGTATTSGLPMIISNPQFFSQDPELETVFSDKWDVTVMSGRELCKTLHRDEHLIYVCVMGKLYHRDLFRVFRFPVGKIHEDQNLVPRLIYTAGQAALIFNKYYCYLHNRPDSIMNEGFSIRRFDDVDGVTACIRFYESHGDNELVQLATEVRDRMRSNCLLASWKRGLWREIPKEHRPGFLKGCAILAKGLLHKVMKK